MSLPTETVDVAILGGGPAGYVAALCAARQGARVVLVEKNKIGGTCLNIGCIPTKALTTAAELLVRSKRASDYGLSIPEVSVNVAGLMVYKRAVVDQLVGGVEQLLKTRRVKVLYGSARMLRPNALLIDSGDGNTHEQSANRIILAPGSVTSVPPVEGRDLPGVVTSTEALNIDTVPPRLVVIGGGVIGLEFACIYEALGSRITVLEMASSVLPTGTDEAIATRLQILLRRRGMQIHTGTTVERIERTGDTLRVFTTGAAGEAVFEGERVLVATGRWPNTSGPAFAEVGLRLERAGHRRR